MILKIIPFLLLAALADPVPLKHLKIPGEAGSFFCFRKESFPQ